MVVEVQLLLKGTKEEVESLLLSQGFSVYHKVRTISKYYLLENECVDKKGNSKFQYKRLRWSCPVAVFGGFEKYLVRYDVDEEQRKEDVLLNTGYGCVCMDDKLDFVYRKEIKGRLYFLQIQEIYGEYLIVAYDNELYYKWHSLIQRCLLVRDLKRFVLPVVDIHNVDRFEFMRGHAIKSVDDIVVLMNCMIDGSMGCGV